MFELVLPTYYTVFLYCSIFQNATQRIFYVNIRKALTFSGI